MSRRPPIFTQIRRAERADELRHEAVVGIVVDNKDPQKLGRVKVKLATISDEASHWAPISSLGAGKDRGWFFLPEIDDEVLVMFAHGELSRPVVIGALWNGVDAPPDTNGGGNERRMIHSRSGHQVVFDDDGDKILFKDGGGVGSVEITGDSITITASEGDVQIQSPAGQLNVKAADIKLTASSDVTLKADGAMKISGSDVKVLGGSKLDISGSTVALNPGGTAQASDADGDTESVPDPV